MKPGYAPKTPTQKLGYLVEECGEVLAAAGKTIRWGLESFNPELPETNGCLANGGRETNRHWLLRELHDLERAIGIVRALILTECETCPSSLHARRTSNRHPRENDGGRYGE